MLNEKTMDYISSNYFTCANKKEKLLATEFAMKAVQNNTDNTHQKEILLATLNASPISFNKIYDFKNLKPDTKENKDMKIVALPASAFCVKYCDGKPGKDVYQRGMHNGKIVVAVGNKIIDIADKVEPYRCGLIIANFNSETGELSIIDGASRFIALILNGAKYILCGVFMDLSSDEQRKVFNSQSLNVRAIDALDMFMCNAGSTEETEKSAKTLYEVASEYHITFIHDYKLLHNCTSVSVLQKFAGSFHEEGLHWVFDILKESGFDNYLHCYRRHLLCGMTFAYSMLKHSPLENPRQVLLEAMKENIDPDNFACTAKKNINPEFSTNGKNGEGPMKEYILQLLGIHVSAEQN